MTEDDFEPARRELCSDDKCTGLIGPDGRCKVCGTVSVSAVADPRHRGMRLPHELEGDDPVELDDDRELCPDGACVGVIGPDGRCKECGAQGTGAPRARPAVAEIERVAASAVTVGRADDGAAFEDDDRELCPDGACVGLIGEDGRCKVCGTAARPASP